MVAKRNLTSFDSWMEDGLAWKVTIATTGFLAAVGLVVFVVYKCSRNRSPASRNSLGDEEKQPLIPQVSSAVSTGNRLDIVVMDIRYLR